ncbi:hypothetical protein C5S53_00830 [Methanophagales archaeon]|nr:hypothetical protein C5S53_00830 [Methanophagales archaeon]
MKTKTITTRVPEDISGGKLNKKEERKKKMVEEEQLVERLAPRIEEKIRYRVVRSIINALEEQFYPPEEMFREEFVKSVEEAEKRVKEGKARTFKNASELNAFLESLKTEE